MPPHLWQRLDAIVKDHDSRVAKCTSDHTKLSDYAARLAEGTSASRVQMMADCKKRHEEAEKAVGEKRQGLSDTMRRREELADRIKGQDKLTMQMRANLQYRELRAKEREEHSKCQAVSSPTSNPDIPWPSLP